jgi:hypothetical protein
MKFVVKDSTYLFCPGKPQHWLERKRKWSREQLPKHLVSIGGKKVLQNEVGHV